MSATRVSVLMYHRVEPQADDLQLCVPSLMFKRQMDWLATHGYVPCTDAQFAKWLDGTAELPERSVLITFDDGFAGLHAHVLPEMASRRWPATVFLVSGCIGGSDDWDRVQRPKPRALLASAQIAEMARHRFSFQSHSHTHADLTQLDDLSLREELARSRQAVSDLLGHDITQLAYPFGRFDARVQAAAIACGYRLCWSVRSGFNRRGADPTALRRLDVTGFDSPSRFGRKVALGTNDGSWRAQGRYLAARIAQRVRARMGGGPA